MNNYLYAFYGSFLYNLALFVLAKNNCDKAEKPFEFGKYFKFNWDNWGLTIAFAPLLVWKLDSVLGAVNFVLGKFTDIQLPPSDIYYFGAGPLTELVLLGLFKLAGWKESWIAPVHKD